MVEREEAPTTLRYSDMIRNMFKKKKDSSEITPEEKKDVSDITLKDNIDTPVVSEDHKEDPPEA